MYKVQGSDLGRAEAKSQRQEVTWREIRVREVLMDDERRERSARLISFISENGVRGGYVVERMRRT